MTKPTIHGNIIFAFGTRDAFAHGEMAEWSKAPVLKTGDVKASVGSNPTLSARKQNTRKYPSGRRGSPAKGVGRQKRREGSNPSFRAKPRNLVIARLPGLSFSAAAEHGKKREGGHLCLPSYDCPPRASPTLPYHHLPANARKTFPSATISP